MINIQPFLDKLDYLEEYLSYYINKPRVTAIDYTFEDYVNSINNGEVYVIIPNQYAGSSMYNRKSHNIKGFRLYWRHVYFTV